MTKKEKGRFDMYEAVLLHFKKNESILATLPAIKNAIGNLNLRVSSIKAAEEFNQKVLTGITTGKNGLKALLADQFAVNAGQLSAWAFDTGNNELQKDADVTIAGLQRKGQNDIVALCSHLLSLFVTHKEPLKEYGIDDNTIGDLQSLLQEFETEKPAYRNARAAKSAKVKRRTEEFTAANKLLRFSIDKQMLKLKANYPEFYDTYRNVRRITQQGSRTTRLRGIITAPDGIAVHKAQVQATEVNTGVKYKTATGINGDYVLRIPKAGTYKVAITHPQWAAAQEQLIEINLGEQQTVQAQFSQAV